MLIESQKVIDVIESYKGYGINAIIEYMIEDIDELCSDTTTMEKWISYKENELRTMEKWNSYIDSLINSGEVLRADEWVNIIMSDAKNFNEELYREDISYIISKLEESGVCYEYERPL